MNSELIKTLKEKGFWVLLMGGAIFWLNGQYENLFLKLDECQENRIEDKNARIDELKTVIQENTDVSKRIIDHLSRTHQ